MRGLRWGLVPVVVLLVGALGGCGGGGGGGDGQPQGASLPTSSAAGGSSAAPGSGSPSAPASSRSTDGGAGHPQYRLDDSDARRTALINAWSQCLLHHGAKRGGRDRGPGAAGPGTTALIVVADPVPPAASAACQDLLPEMPPETEASTNPDFHEQSLDYVACMKKKGLWVELLNDHDLDWTYADGHPVPGDSDQIEHGCLLEAFGGS